MNGLFTRGLASGALLAAFLGLAAVGADAGVVEDALRAQLGANAPTGTIETLAARLKPEQAMGAKDALTQLEPLADAATLDQIGKGYLALKSPLDALRVAARLQQLQPKAAAGFTMAANASLAAGDPRTAVDYAKQALALAPNDTIAQSVLRLAREKSAAPAARAAAVSPTSAPSAAEGPLPAGELRLSAQDAARVDSLLAKLAKSSTGKAIIVAVVPDSGGKVDLQRLQKAGVAVHAMSAPEQGEYQKVRPAEGTERDKYTHVLVLTREVLHEPTAAGTPVLAQGLVEVKERRSNGDSFSIVLIKQKATTLAIHVWEDLAQAGEQLAGSSMVAQTWTLLSSIWGGNTAQTPPPQNISNSALLADYQAASRAEESGGPSGVDAIWQRIFLTFKLQDMTSTTSSQGRSTYQEQVRRIDTQYRDSMASGATQ